MIDIIFYVFMALVLLLTVAAIFATLNIHGNIVRLVRDIRMRIIDLKIKEIDFNSND